VGKEVPRVEVVSCRQTELEGEVMEAVVCCRLTELGKAVDGAEGN
jgi:hypothetical protein